MSHLKVAGAFHKPKGITVKQNNPWHVTNTVLLVSFRPTFACQYSEYRSKVLKY